MNNKGLFLYQGCVFMGAMFAVFAFASHAMHDPNSFSAFRAKKAIQYCVEAGKTNCAETVSKMSKEEIFAYIKR